MNRMSDRQRRERFIKITSVLLFTFLLTGFIVLSVQGKGHGSEASASVKSSISDKSPLMQETSLRRLVDLQSTIGKNMFLTQYGQPMAFEKSDSNKSVDSAKKEVQDNQKKDSDAEKTELAGFVYNEDIPMPKEHQAYLYKLCKERGLDYQKALAVIQHESNYNPNEISETHDYGYFQINRINHENLASTLKTPKKPLDPYININWGTYKLSDLYAYWKKKGVTGSRLDEYVWSSYNKGLGGFQKHGTAVAYVKSVREALTEIKTSFV